MAGIMIRKLLGLKKDPIEVEIGESVDKFREEKNSDIESARKKADKRRDKIQKEFDNLEKDLKDLNEFEDEKDRQVINDVVDNVIEDRLEMVEDFEFPEDPEKLYSELDDFIEQFQSLTQKEAAVLEEAYLQGDISKTIGGLEKQREKLEEFLNSEYEVVKNFEKLKELLDNREKLLEDIDEFENQIKGLEVEGLESELEVINSDISDLEDSSDWSDYEYLHSEVDEKKSEKENIVSDIRKSLGKMERGLKKLIYESKNGNESIEKVDTLEKLRDKDIDYILERPEKTVKALEEARNGLPEDLLNQTQEEKFSNSVEELKDLEKRANRIESLEKEINELENQVEDHKVIKRKDKLESKRKTKKRKLKEEKEEKDTLEDKIEDKKSVLEEIDDHIEEIFSDSFNREINFS